MRRDWWWINNRWSKSWLLTWHSQLERMARLRHRANRWMIMDRWWISDGLVLDYRLPASAPLPSFGSGHSLTLHVARALGEVAQTARRRHRVNHSRWRHGVDERRLPAPFDRQKSKSQSLGLIVIQLPMLISCVDFRWLDISLVLICILNRLMGGATRFICF